MNTCATCRHWERSYGQRYKLGDCRKPINIESSGGGYEAVGPRDMGLDYPVCDLVTGPEFGCTLWEPHNAPTTQADDRDDAARYRFIRGNFASMNPHMGGDHNWRLHVGGWLGRAMRGPTFDSAVDNAMQQAREHEANQCPDRGNPPS